MERGILKQFFFLRTKKKITFIKYRKSTQQKKKKKKAEVDGSYSFHPLINLLGSISFRKLLLLRFFLAHERARMKDGSKGSAINSSKKKLSANLLRGTSAVSFFFFLFFPSEYFHALSREPRTGLQFQRVVYKARPGAHLYLAMNLAWKAAIFSHTALILSSGGRKVVLKCHVPSFCPKPLPGTTCR
jgi:hypothetical protein